MSKTEELLKVLDLPEDDQIIWCAKNAGYNLLDTTLADLAFRLRDEVCKDSLSCDNYHNALRIVYQSFRKSQEGTVRQNMVTYTLWLESLITPIERIIAALIAKDMENGN